MPDEDLDGVRKCGEDFGTHGVVILLPAFVVLTVNKAMVSLLLSRPLNAEVARKGQEKWVMDARREGECDRGRTSLVEIQLVLQQRLQRQVLRLLRRRQIPVQIFRQAIRHQSLADEGRFRNGLRVRTAILRDGEVGDFPTRTLVRRTLVSLICETAKAEAGLQLGDKGGPDICCRDWEAAVEG